MNSDNASLIPDIPRERRRWVRPPLIGQPSGAPEILPTTYHDSLESTGATPEPEDKINPQQDSEIITEDRSNQRKESSSLETADREAKAASPTSSVTSHKPLEWDSGADVGYNALTRNKEKDRNMLCTIERMALARGLCSAALRLDPEGTTGSTADPGGTQNNSPSRSNRRQSKPDAHSTRIINDASESEGEIEITPIVKTNLPGIITGKVTGTQDITLKSLVPRKFSEDNGKDNEKETPKMADTPKTSQPGKYKSANERFAKARDLKDFQDSSMKKSASMNVLAMPLMAVSLKRSQSELNLRENEETKRTGQGPLNFASTSSIVTIVNKPLTCDKDIQTTFQETLRKESIGIQVSSIEDEEKSVDASKCQDNSPENSNDSNNSNNSNISKKSQKSKYSNTSETSHPLNSKSSPQEDDKPPLPKRISSLSQRPQSILKNSRSDSTQSKKDSRSDRNTSSETPSETDAGRASHSFEYFPGHVYQNVPGESTSHVSSVDTRHSHSTMPNTSSSLDEKLWGDSDSLLQDLERSLNILKSLVDANKCDKHVKKRLIHHVIKRLVSAKYTDDKISHDLEETVPWNPDNARNKVYRTEIIQALAKKQKPSNSTEESSEEWKPRKSSSFSNKPQDNSRVLKEMIQLVASSENSDLFEGRHTDRTDGMQDGRKARMGLRSEDRHRHLQREVPLDTEKSESSECFLPQQIPYKSNTDNKSGAGKTAQSSGNTTTQRRRGGDDKMDWRLPTTMSERRFELERCNYRAGATTRLIDYVEMEKKNQLVWISNEIDHLSNLKKLLEEPKRYSRSCKGSRKSGNEEKIDSDEYSERINDEWSSHGNLADRMEVGTRKKNSCTQTLGQGISKEEKESDIVDGMEGLMRESGGEVVSDCGGGITESSRGPSPSWSPRRNCLVHGNKRGVCKCQKPNSSSSDAGGMGLIRGTGGNGDRRPREKVGQGSNKVDTKKEAKNRLNDKCRSEFSVTEYQEEFVSRGKSHCRGCRCGGNVSGGERAPGKNNGEVRDRTRSRENRKSEECTCDENSRRDEGRELRSCRTCGTVYTSVDKKCQCNLSYVKPIAYELNFKEPRSPQGRRGSSSRGETANSEGHSCKSDNCYCQPPQPQLKDYLTKNKPEFVDNVETRKRYMSELSQLRQLKKEKRMQFLAVASPGSLIASPKNVKATGKTQKKISDEEMKMRLRHRYLRLNEVRNKRRQKEKDEAAKRNHLMAKIFCKKLQQKVLRGDVDLSQSVSVISNL
uniref:ALMS motif domain-containing protein n=1 Tax=Fopius arisanus TaxID=64838 RepID=A0A0C9RR66_9HYME